MSEIRLVQSGVGFGSGILPFPDLKFRLEKHLGLAQKIPDLEDLIGYLNGLMKEDRYSTEEQFELKRIRQKAYDRKRNPKMGVQKTEPSRLFSLQMKEPDLDAQIPDLGISGIQIQDPDSKTSDLEKVQTPDLTPQIQDLEKAQTPKSELPKTILTKEPRKMILQSIEQTPKLEFSPSQKNKVTFWTGAQKALESIDGEKFVKALPGFLLLFMATAAVVGFLWLQSLELYKSSGFSQPELASAGGLLMVIGFAVYRSVTRSKLALLLCLYAGGYETYFMVSGTVQDEKTSQIVGIENSPDLMFLREKADKIRGSYISAKSRYEDPASKVYQNEWFKTKYLDPAWKENEEAQTQFLAKKEILQEQGKSLSVTWLKVLYRIGLVLLCMIFIHILFDKKHISAQ